MTKPLNLSKPLKFQDYKNYCLGDLSDTDQSLFERKALKQTFYGPYYSKTNFAFNLFTPITAPVTFSIIAVALPFLAIGLTFKSVVDLCHKPKEGGATRSAESLRSIEAARFFFLLAIAAAILAALSPLIALASVIGSSVATLAEKCSKPTEGLAM